MQLLLSTVLSAFALTAVSASIAPNSVAKLQLTTNTDLCVGSTGTAVGSPLSLESCNSALTTFNLPRGAPGTATQLALNATLSGAGPKACASAHGLDVDGTLILDVCQDDAAQRWTVQGETGKGPIVAGTGSGVYCLTASSTTEGSAITYSACSGSEKQEWSPVAA
ncbi:unnamed protein product [Peniophora sp. CBMAI 1063]|nr:unnamed protein product [Peniophora sp. CBMAI 1063]